jgi:hypothetical protein
MTGQGNEPPFTCAIRDCDEDGDQAVVFGNIIGDPSVIRLCGYHADGIRYGEVADG